MLFDKRTARRQTNRQDLDYERSISPSKDATSGYAGTVGERIQDAGLFYHPERQNVAEKGRNTGPQGWRSHHCGAANRSIQCRGAKRIVGSENIRDVQMENGTSMNVFGPLRRV